MVKDTLSWQKLMVILKTENSGGGIPNQDQIYNFLPGFKSLQIYLAYLCLLLPSLHSLLPILFQSFPASFSLMNTILTRHTPSHYLLSMFCSFPTLFRLFLITKMSIYNLINLIWIGFFSLKKGMQNLKVKALIVALKNM